MPPPCALMGWPPVSRQICPGKNSWRSEVFSAARDVARANPIIRNPQKRTSLALNNVIDYSVNCSRTKASKGQGSNHLLVRVILDGDRVHLRFRRENTRGDRSGRVSSIACLTSYALAQTSNIV